MVNVDLLNSKRCEECTYLLYKNVSFNLFYFLLILKTYFQLEVMVRLLRII